MFVGSPLARLKTGSTSLSEEPRMLHPRVAPRTAPKHLNTNPREHYVRRSKDSVSDNTVSNFKFPNLFGGCKGERRIFAAPWKPGST